MLKLITRPGCERIVRYAFEYARGIRPPQGHLHDQGQHHEADRRAVPPGLRRDRGGVSRRSRPSTRSSTSAPPGSPRSRERFDVIVTLNLYGDILSDIASQIAGSVGSPARPTSATGVAMFEAVHGSAPDIAGQDIANPSGLLLAADADAGPHRRPLTSPSRIKNAWLRRSRTASTPPTSTATG